jgi:hypothetical protein
MAEPVRFRVGQLRSRPPQGGMRSPAARHQHYLCCLGAIFDVCDPDPNDRCSSDSINTLTVLAAKLSTGQASVALSICDVFS